jgi:hypothetical protein
MAIKTNTLSLQKKISKCKTSAMKKKIDTLQNLKKNYVTKAHEIFNIEREISEIQEQDLRDELSNYKQFERLNSEKITPYFMKLVKQSCAAYSLDGINYDTTEYNCRDDAITMFYEKLY